MKTLQDYETIEQTCKSLNIDVPQDPELRARFREVWSNRKKQWAIYALHAEFGIECLNKWCGICGFHSAAEIAHEKQASNE